MQIEVFCRTRVLQAFANAARLDFDELLELTEIDENALTQTLSGMVGERLLRRNGNVYWRTQVEAHVPQFIGEDEKHLPLLLGLTEEEALTRIRMLVHMRSRLLSPWHPIIDKLMGDYQKGLQIVESLRYGAGNEPRTHSSMEN